MAVRELASGIDSLYLSGKARLPLSLLTQLDRAKARAAKEHGPVAFELGGVEFGLTPYGWGRYPFRLSHEFGLIGFQGVGERT